MDDNKNDKSIYPPKMRNFASTDCENILSYKKKTFVNIPGLGVDPIVSENIVCPEFDYTENLADKNTTKE